MCEEVGSHTFSDELADRLLANGKLLSAIAMHDTADLQLRRQMLLSQIAACYEFVNYYRKEQDGQWSESQTANLYARFCDLVVTHHREHRDVQFYAAQLGYSTRYFSKLFLKSSNGITALDYIGQYVCTQAKRIMDTAPPPVRQGHRPGTRIPNVQQLLPLLQARHRHLPARVQKSAI